MNSCRDCKDRRVGCHSNCEKYKKWKIEHNKDVEKERSIINKYSSYFYSK